MKSKSLDFLGFSNYTVSESGEVMRVGSKVLNQHKKEDGYITVSIYSDDKKHTTLRVHRLVALAFIPEIEGKPHVNHKDGNKENNHVSNLEWVSRSENMLHAHETGLFINRPRSIPNEVVHEMCKMFEQGIKPVDVAKVLQVDVVIAHNITRGKTYTFISDNYDLSKVPRHNKLDDSLVKDICERIVSKQKLVNIASETGINLSSVKAIKQRRVYNHISDSYAW